MSDDFDTLGKDLLDLLLDRTPDVFLLVDPKRMEILAARGPSESLLGKPASALCPMPLAALCPRQPAPHLPCLGPIHFAQEGRWAEMAIAGAGGMLRVCSVWVVPLDPPGRGPVLVRLTDISERYDLERKLRAAQQGVRKVDVERAREQQARQEKRRTDLLYIFAAGLSHELNNPLCAALANFAAAQDICREAAERPSRENAAEMHELMRDSHAALKRMEGLVKSLRQLEYQPRAQPLDAAAWLRKHPDLAGIELEAPETLPVRSDPVLLERILVPLLDNARRAMNGRPGIRLVLAKAPDGFSLRVEDRGPGVPPDLAERVFDPFFTTRPPGQGLGLGLFLARHAAQQLGGTLTLEPRDGGGCVAVARLPMDSTPFGVKAGSAQYESFRTPSR